MADTKEEAESELCALLREYGEEQERHWAVNDKLWVKIRALIGDTSRMLTGPEMDDIAWRSMEEWRANRKAKERGIN